MARIHELTLPSQRLVPGGSCGRVLAIYINNLLIPRKFLFLHAVLPLQGFLILHSCKGRVTQIYRGSGLWYQWRIVWQSRALKLWARHCICWIGVILKPSSVEWDVRFERCGFDWNYVKGTATWFPGSCLMQEWGVGLESGSSGKELFFCFLLEEKNFSLKSR